LQQASLRFARGATERTDQVTQRLIEDTERAVLRTLGNLKRNAGSAGQFGSKYASFHAVRDTSSDGVS
jgi:hypothetical protein